MRYKSNMQHVLGKLTKGIGVRNADALARTMALALYASQIDRIHGKGQAVSLQPIGKYSQKPGYYDVESYKANSVNMGMPTGGRKRGRSTFGHGGKHEMRYFPDGYKGFKAYLGYPTDHVNLTLTKRLKEDTQMKRKAIGDYIIGFMTPYGTAISQKNEVHFHTQIWGLTVKDRDIMQHVAQDFIKNINRA